MEKDKLYKRLVAEIPIEIHNRIRAVAAWENITIRKWLLQTIVERLAEEEKRNQ